MSVMVGTIEKIFRKFVKLKVSYVLGRKVLYDRPIISGIILGKPEGVPVQCASTHCPCYLPKYQQK